MISKAGGLTLLLVGAAALAWCGRAQAPTVPKRVLHSERERAAARPVRVAASAALKRPATAPESEPEPLVDPQEQLLLRQLAEEARDDDWATTTENVYSHALAAPDDEEDPEGEAPVELVHVQCGAKLCRLQLGVLDNADPRVVLEAALLRLGETGERLVALPSVDYPEARVFIARSGEALPHAKSEPARPPVESGEDSGVAQRM